MTHVFLWQLAGVLCFVLYGLQKDIVNLYIAIVLFVVVIITSTMSFLQEGQSAKIMNSFKVSG